MFEEALGACFESGASRAPRSPPTPGPRAGTSHSSPERHAAGVLCQVCHGHEVLSSLCGGAEACCSGCGGADLWLWCYVCDPQALGWVGSAIVSGFRATGRFLYGRVQACASLLGGAGGAPDGPGDLEAQPLVPGGGRPA